MKIKYTPELTKQFYILEERDLRLGLKLDTSLQTGDVLYERDDPVLTYDPFDLKKTRKGKIANILFKRNPITIQYETTMNDWDETIFPNTWPASIDTLFLAKTAREAIHKTKPGRILDLGCGSGFLGQYLMKALNGEHCTFVDINGISLSQAMLNVSKHDPEIYSHSKFSSHIEDEPSEKYDLIVINPPYVPSFKDKDEINPYNGTNLLERAVISANDRIKNNGYFAINYSHLASGVAEKALDESGLVLISEETKVVPFRIPPILKNKDWVDYLVSDKGLRVRESSDYEYEHTLISRVYQN
jgi:methylase of polypeptide subunit release factors